MTLAEELPCVSRERGAYREAFQAPSSLSFFPRPVPWAMIAMRLRREDMGRSNGDRDSRRRRRQDSRRGRNSLPSLFLRELDSRNAGAGSYF